LATHTGCDGIAAPARGGVVWELDLEQRVVGDTRVLASASRRHRIL
jgi:hypothetical protein